MPWCKLSAVLCNTISFPTFEIAFYDFLHLLFIRFFHAASAHSRSFSLRLTGGGWDTVPIPGPCPQAQNPRNRALSRGPAPVHVTSTEVPLVLVSSRGTQLKLAKRTDAQNSEGEVEGYANHQIVLHYIRILFQAQKRKHSRGYSSGSPAATPPDPAPEECGTPL